MKIKIVSCCPPRTSSFLKWEQNLNMYGSKLQDSGLRLLAIDSARLDGLGQLDFGLLEEGFIRDY